MVKAQKPDQLEKEIQLVTVTIMVWTWTPIEEQPGYCYLQLFNQEIRDQMDWLAYPTL